MQATCGFRQAALGLSQLHSTKELNDGWIPKLAIVSSLLALPHHFATSAVVGGVMPDSLDVVLTVPKAE